MTDGQVIPFEPARPRRKHGAGEPDGTPAQAGQRQAPAVAAARSAVAEERGATTPATAAEATRAAGDAPEAEGPVRFRDLTTGDAGDAGIGAGRATGSGSVDAGDANGAGWQRPDAPRPGLAARIGQQGLDRIADLVDAVARPGWERRASRTLAFLRRRLAGDYQTDEFGFDPELNDRVLMALLRPLYERYFRVELRGVENVPATGGGLLVANHSGTLPLDALMTQVALLDHHPAHRNLRMLAADLVFTLPFVGELARKSGHTLACAADAERLLRGGEIVGVWPEGFKGVGKPFSERYKLQRFGRGGFVAAALRTGVPIVPAAIVGAEEIYPMLANAKPLARLLNVPYFPITPTFPLLGPLGLLPLPSKWFIAFGEPIPTDGYEPAAADDPMLVFNLADQVRETIQDTLYRMLLERRAVFF